MGNKDVSKKKKIPTQKVADDFEGFFLEDWEILADKSKLKDYQKDKNKISYNNELLISQVKTDPFKDYQEIKQLGAGSFAKVLLVKNNSTGVIRAMKIIKKKKVLKSSSESDGSTDLEILNEINILKQIDHPNVVKIFEFYNSEDAYYLITEYC